MTSSRDTCSSRLSSGASGARRALPCRVPSVSLRVAGCLRARDVVHPAGVFLNDRKRAVVRSSAVPSGPAPVVPVPEEGPREVSGFCGGFRRLVRGSEIRVAGLRHTPTRVVSSILSGSFLSTILPNSSRTNGFPDVGVSVLGVLSDERLLEIDALEVPIVGPDVYADVVDARRAVVGDEILALAGRPRGPTLARVAIHLTAVRA